MPEWAIESTMQKLIDANSNAAKIAGQASATQAPRRDGAIWRGGCSGASPGGSPSFEVALVGNGSQVVSVTYHADVGHDAQMAARRRAALASLALTRERDQTAGQ